MTWSVSEPLGDDERFDSGEVTLASGCFHAAPDFAGVFGALIVASAASAADLPTQKAPPAPVQPAQIDYYQPFFVKLGFTYALNQSYSNLWAQNPTAMATGNFATFPLGVGATLGNVPTLGVESGLFVTRNVSVNVSGGIPMYVNDKTKGFNWQNPLLPDGTVLAKLMEGLIPVTAVYHFDNFGAFRPYVGAGVAVAFPFATKEGFTTGVHVSSAAGPVLRTGFDYMLTPNWGFSADVTKTFTDVESNAEGINVPGIGSFPVASYQHARFQPWIFSVGIVYAFGKDGKILPTF